ncbi:DoxX family protein [Dictyobacter arantiisoli]|uniref:DoxX family protein n=1 Tax=Dictyobacter arantiisoli TaxID=2014874 RepID=A0A5A5TE71_9CHLR|nr:DoxX family protein [Dictyobacter arantiisoli]GCF09538.1 hypothetical protein KDI_31020 [Dictyobacter arantiisoli]
MRFSSWVPFAPLPIRIIVGIIFIFHGIMKFIQPGQAVSVFGHLGIPFPGLAAPVIGLLEVIGGLCLVIGLLTRIFSVLLIIEMIVGILTATLAAGLLGGSDLELVVIAGLLSLILSGPGPLSLAHRLQPNPLLEGERETLLA